MFLLQGCGSLGKLLDFLVTGGDRFFHGHVDRIGAACDPFQFLGFRQQPDVLATHALCGQLVLIEVRHGLRAVRVAHVELAVPEFLLHAPLGAAAFNSDHVTDEAT